MSRLANLWRAESAAKTALPEPQPVGWVLLESESELQTVADALAAVGVTLRRPTPLEMLKLRSGLKG